MEPIFKFQFPITYCLCLETELTPELWPCRLPSCYPPWVLGALGDDVDFQCRQSHHPEVKSTSSPAGLPPPIFLDLQTRKATQDVSHPPLSLISGKHLSGTHLKWDHSHRCAIDALHQVCQVLLNSYSSGRWVFFFIIIIIVIRSLNLSNSFSNPIKIGFSLFSCLGTLRWLVVK